MNSIYHGSKFWGKIAFKLIQNRRHTYKFNFFKLVITAFVAQLVRAQVS